MKSIQITNERTYKGIKDGDWTETCTGERVLQREEAFIHKSHNPIKAFQAGIVTCAYDTNDSENFFFAPKYSEIKSQILVDLTQKATGHTTDEYVYAITLPKGTRVVEYGNNEIRFVLTLDAKINFLGRMGEVKMPDAKNFPYETRVYGGVRLCVWTKKEF
jgi:hypothetical protein